MGYAEAGSADRPRSLIAEANSHLGAIEQDIRSLSARYTEIAGRAIGEVPDAPVAAKEPNIPRPVRSGEMGELLDRLDLISNLMPHLQRTAQRLEDLV